ncbi:class I SAM-dependent methyltransferase [Halorussus litoreus]|uniref:class I SAM-dependent methyltransferase n=1 Tax=Halorussus litoreus TaxID=1710536 RepID=UPI000E22F880|nr:class I SAM-dependent methyltransferase [Halorussus litoreus]
MKRSLDEHASRFDEVAGEYDDSQNDTEEYRACVSLVVEHAVGEARSASESPSGQRPRGLSESDTVLDLGTGTGAIALALADDAGDVIGRDISEGMMEQAREKADEQGIENVEFGEGRFREPNVGADREVDVVVSNFAMHHLSDEEKREAIEAIAELGPQRFVLGDVMFFGEPNPDEPFYSPEVDDPSTVGYLADALTDAGFALTAVEQVHDQVGVLVAERRNGE